MDILVGLGGYARRFKDRSGKPYWTNPFAGQEFSAWVSKPSPINLEKLKEGGWVYLTPPEFLEGDEE